jgi:hypothetical protein
MLMITIFILFSALVKAQEKDSLMSAYQRELTHLSSQKVQLEADQKDLTLEFLNKSKQARVDLEKLNRELARLQVENDSRSEELSIQERDLKKNIASKAQLESIWKRINGGIIKARDFVGLQKDSGEKSQLPDDLNLMSFVFVKDAVLKLLRQANSLSHQELTYYSENGALVEAEVLRWGSLAAFAKNGDELSLLAPTEQSVLQILPLKNDSKFLISQKFRNGGSAFIPMYLFDSMSERGQFIKPASFADHFIKFIPGLLLLGLFLLVIGLFVSLARH